MIEALVLVLAVGLAAGAAFIVGSRTATNNVLDMAEEELVPAAAKDVIEELLVNPDTAHLMKQVVRDYAQGRRMAMGSVQVEGKKITGITDGILDETPDYGPFVIDSAVEELKNWEAHVSKAHDQFSTDRYWQKETPSGILTLTDSEYQALRVEHGLEPMPVSQYRAEVELDADGNRVETTTSK